MRPNALSCACAYADAQVIKPAAPCAATWLIYVTVHDKTNHIAAKMIFELRRPLPKSTFELRLEKNLKSLAGVVMEI